jgi:alpha-aminoadipic semialdehyde synthase
MEIKSVFANPSNTVMYKVVFKEEHIVEPLSSEKPFDLQDYYRHPEKYRSVFEQYIPSLSILMNCVYWSSQYPRLVTKDFLKKSFKQKEKLRLKVIGDISADVNGAIECNMKTTSTDNPVFVYNPITESVQDGSTGEGLVVMSVDNLPCELPRESSQEFGDALLRFVPEIMKADFSVSDFKSLAVPVEVKNAVILYRGKLTPPYEYINKFL